MLISYDIPHLSPKGCPVRLSCDAVTSYIDASQYCARGVLMIHVKDLATKLAEHPLYRSIDDDAAMRLFMRSHVFCVWDFMSLLKTLQRGLTCIETPWHPRGDRKARRFINEIVVAEESDAHPDGGYISHFE